MAAERPSDPRVAAVDKVLATWRQGDCVIGEQWFALRLAIDHPISFEAHAVAAIEADLAESDVPGFVVVTQTCDIIRSCAERPFIEVCPLIKMDDSKVLEVARGRRPAYAFVPGLINQCLVADLDRTMTVEKPVVAKWLRTPGCTSDVEIRAFAQALARKRMRFAFPDDFTDFVKKLQGRLIDKHEKNTDEGRGLRALREIRVQATPSWDALPATLMFWFIRHDSDADFEGKSWTDLLNEWLQWVPKAGRFTEVEGQVVTLVDLTGADYVGSDPLDLDHLSSHNETK